MSSPSETARELIARGAILLDVRTPHEFAAAHADGAVNIPVQELPFRVGEIPEGKDLVVYCRSGSRSSVAAALLRARGHQVVDVGTLEAARAVT